MKRFWPLLPATVIALLLVALFCSRSRTGGTSTGTSLAAPTGSAPKLSSKIAPELIAKTMRGEVTRAIAVLQSSTNLGNEVKDLEKRLKGTVGSSGFRQLGTRPLVAIPTDLATLKQLDDAPQVVKVVTDRIARSSISRSAKQIEADKLWDAGKEGAEVSVAILDTGIDPTHPFLGGRVVKQVCYSQPDAYGHVSLCPNGQAKDESANAATPVDITIANHGTHVAGIAAGFNGTFRE
jgi:subtilisin family serine protease